MRGRCAAVALAALLLPACSGGSGDVVGGAATGAGAASAGAGVAGTVTVLAAASLTVPLTDLATAWERANPGAAVRLSFGSSTTLAQQVAQGAPADLLATAGTQPLVQLGDVTPTETTIIARNTLEIATPPEDPAGVGGIADLGRSDVDVVLCVESAPCGKAADQVLAAAGVTAHVVSREVDAAATLTKVALGEADAAVVYHSDVVSSDGRVRGVEIPADQNTTLDYPLARFTDTATAVGFAAYLGGPQGRAGLTAAGLLSP